MVNLRITQNDYIFLTPEDLLSSDYSKFRTGLPRNEIENIIERISFNEKEYGISNVSEVWYNHASYCDIVFTTEEAKNLFVMKYL